MGGILTSDTKIDSNITDRYNKGIGCANQILSILKEISFGQYYFEEALQFRNAKLINGMLCSIESIHGLTKSHVEQLEQCDRFLMRKMFNCVSSTAIEAYYLETNTLPLRFVIIARRLMFYWDILQKPALELVNQVFKAQTLSPVRNDWCLKVDEDLKYCNIGLSESEISSMKKNKFKTLVTEKIHEVAKLYLIKLKNKHSKSDGLSADGKVQDYLTSSKLTTEEKQLHLRTRTFECKANYSSLYNAELACSICLEEDNQGHLLRCGRTTNGVDLKGVQYVVFLV